MATQSQNIFLTRKETLVCNQCYKAIAKGQHYVAETEKNKGTCLKCSTFRSFSFLPSGDAAMTRRSKKHSSRCGIVQQWNPRRKRYERKGQFIELSSIALAKQECDADKEKRAISNIKAATKREIDDKIYIVEFSKAIKNRYPNCPTNRDVEIAKHACLKHSGRVGRTANAKQFDTKMIDLAVEAHIRHAETNYDNQFGKGIGKREIRSNLKYDILKIMGSWKLKV